MRILCQFQSNAWSYGTEGWRRVFEACGHEWRYQKWGEAAFDAFKFEPDLFIGRTHLVDRAVIKNIRSRPNIKAIFSAGHAGPIEKDKGDLDLFITPMSERELIARLHDETGRPNFVFAHFPQKYIPYAMSGWEDLGIPVRSLMHGADTFVYYPGNYREELAADFGFCGGYWPTKGIGLRKYLFPLFDQYKWKIFGNQSWPTANYLGLADDNTVRDLFASVKIAPNCSEIQAYMIPSGEVCERPLKVCYSGALCISDNCSAINEMMNGKMPVATDPNDFHELCHYYMKNEDQRKKVAEECREHVRRHHTYFHRVEYMLRELGFGVEADEVKQKRTEIIGV